ncbi:PREDICTED: zinc finger BED domain-containing [Prunus dulcis]|uniref:PREDICTED: zinc finger BED domain-containing n=1 Tax=Prunus dulcis TaxID=3755 RepID=A0A5E4F686_PRUDU|nr:PREDICTED: zinc finger BED domain-containing [Prunus dulcis]
MAVTAHYMDHEWKLYKRIINFIKITSRKGDDIGKRLDACLNSWGGGIKKVFDITIDNACAMIGRWTIWPRGLSH